MFQGKFELVIRDPIVSPNNFSIVVSWTPPLLTPGYYNITYLCSLLCDSQQISENSSIVAGEAVTHTIYPLNAHSQCNVSVTAVFDSIGSNRITFLTNTTSAGNFSIKVYYNFNSQFHFLFFQFLKVPLQDSLMYLSAAIQCTLCGTQFPA